MQGGLRCHRGAELGFVARTPELGIPSQDRRSQCHLVALERESGPPSFLPRSGTVSSLSCTFLRMKRAVVSAHFGPVQGERRTKRSSEQNCIMTLGIDIIFARVAARAAHSALQVHIKARAFRHLVPDEQHHISSRRTSPHELFELVQ